MASSSITSWQRDGETMRTETEFIFLGSKINVDGDCSHRIKGHLLLGRKDMTNLVYKKQRCYFANKVRLVKAKAFPVVKYGYESWTKNKIKHQRTDAFQLWCSKRLMTVPWTARRSNQSILNKISSEHSMETLTLVLKLQYFGHWIQRADSLEKTLMLGKVEVGRRRE